MFYEQEKRDTQAEATKKRLEEEKRQKEEMQKTANNMEEDDPWMKSKFTEETNDSE